ncbi:MAG: hypothetical protein ABI670_10555 [Chloroflexota bacterium]
MPDAKTQRIVGWLVFVGVLSTCFGCGLLWQNQVNAAVIMLVVAELIIIPTFIYLTRTRRRLKKVARIKETEQLNALAGVGDMVDSSRNTEAEGDNTTGQSRQGQDPTS